MATLFDEMDTKCCLACESLKIAYICTDCTGQRLNLCKDCYKGHVSAGHKVVDINEYKKNPSMYLLAEERECKTHQGEQLKLVCELCTGLLCLMCPHDSEVTCVNAQGGEGKHKTGPLKTAVKSDNKLIDESLDTATHREDDVKAAINRCKQMKHDILSQHNQIKEQAELDEQKLVSAVKAKTRTTINRSVRALELANAQVDEAIGDMDHFLENLQRTREEAEGLKSSSADMTVHRLTPSVVDRLTTPVNFPDLNVPTLKLESPIELNEADEVEKLVGSLGSYLKGDVLVEGVARSIPFQCCTIQTTNGTKLVVEAHSPSGLFVTLLGEARKKISTDGVGHTSVCTSPDEKMVYSTTSQNTICMYAVEDEILTLMSVVAVGGARNLNGIKASRTTGNLAVVDCTALRITLHDKAAALLRSIENVLTGNPIMLEWSLSGDHLFITNTANSGAVVKLKVEPAEIIWTRSVNQTPAVNRPWLIMQTGGCLYITHWDSPKVTVMSAVDGSIFKTITTPGLVRGLRKPPHADLEVVYYT